MKRVLHIVGARPNFMKAAPAVFALEQRSGFTQKVVHTGQHYDDNMSRIFFDQLGMPRPDINLEVGSATHAVQTAEIMMRLEPVLEEERPDIVLVYGDVNSTVAAALVAVKLGIATGHVEAGLRSFDRTMPEEINRLLTDQVADFLFTPSDDGDQNLEREGIPGEKVFLVGNLMIDTLVRLLPRATRPAVGEWAERFALVTLHRPSNVDDPAMLARLMETLASIGKELQVVFPIHPRTRQRIAEAGLTVEENGGVLLLDPLGYLEFLWLQQNAAVVVTDSGGIQEETTYLDVPCLTLRENTERPITVDMGTNTIVGRDMELLQREVATILSGEGKTGLVPPLWDGQAGERVAAILEKHL